jgi:hypothetical protein
MMMTTNSRRVDEINTINGCHLVCDGLRSSPPTSTTHVWKPYTGPSFDDTDQHSVFRESIISNSEITIETATTAVVARAAIVTIIIDPSPNISNNKPPPTPKLSSRPFDPRTFPTRKSVDYTIKMDPSEYSPNSCAGVTALTLDAKYPQTNIRQDPSPDLPPSSHYTSPQAAALLDALRWYLLLPNSNTPGGDYGSSPAHLLASLLIIYPSVRRNLRRRNRSLAKLVEKIDWTGVQEDLMDWDEARLVVEVWMASGLKLFGNWHGPWEKMPSPLTKAEKRKARVDMVIYFRSSSPLAESSAGSARSASPAPTKAPAVVRKRSGRVQKGNPVRRKWKV